ncbi:uncharacterized protein LOC116943328 isoform X2 [Petromyzon marinus]|uniref:uncharacterized protein LOC116943328 isoform X2 n=1 Tax=Petromyzon marinus TaxID=7757 RepID=UPI003F7242ED
MTSVRVVVRVRPRSKKEVQCTEEVIVDVKENVLSIRNVKTSRWSAVGNGGGRDLVTEFPFDRCFWSVEPAAPDFASQHTMFQELGLPVVEAAVTGYNASLFAYGQTGSGKTYTMMGTPESLGLIPRICEGLFTRIERDTRATTTYKVEVSFVEIYNEAVRDLLKRPTRRRAGSNLRVREHPERGPYVQGLSRHLVSSYDPVAKLIGDGNANRMIASTHVHEASSRSHAIFTLHFTQASLHNNLPSEIVSKINLIDLAGSERADPNYNKDRITEGSNINRSLVTLGSVISALAENAALGGGSGVGAGAGGDAWGTALSEPESGKLRGPSASGGRSRTGGPARRGGRLCHVPYRDSVLTRLLKDSLGGNSRTVMIATVSPACSSYGETMSVLRYAARAKNIVNRPKINEDPNVRIIRELRQEVDRLKAMLLSVEPRDLAPLLSEGERDSNLAEMLHENEMKVERLTRDWSDGWRDTRALLEEHTLGINRLRAGVEVASQLPHLLSTDGDVLSTGVTINRLREGRTTIGRSDAPTEQDIVLCGPWMEREHCVIENTAGEVTLLPMAGATCCVNGRDVSQPCRLHQGSVILLGRTHMFRFNHPAQAAKLRQRRSVGEFPQGSWLSLISSGSGDTWDGWPGSPASDSNLSSPSLIASAGAERGGGGGGGGGERGPVCARSGEEGGEEEERPEQRALNGGGRRRLPAETSGNEQGPDRSRNPYRTAAQDRSRTDRSLSREQQQQQQQETSGSAAGLAEGLVGAVGMEEEEEVAALRAYEQEVARQRRLLERLRRESEEAGRRAARQLRIDEELLHTQLRESQRCMEDESHHLQQLGSPDRRESAIQTEPLTDPAEASVRAGAGTGGHGRRVATTAGAAATTGACGVTAAWTGPAPYGGQRLAEGGDESTEHTTAGQGETDNACTDFGSATTEIPDEDTDTAMATNAADRSRACGDSVAPPALGGGVVAAAAAAAARPLASFHGECRMVREGTARDEREAATGRGGGGIAATAERAVGLADSDEAREPDLMARVDGEARPAAVCATVSARTSPLAPPDKERQRMVHLELLQLDSAQCVKRTIAHRRVQYRLDRLAERQHILEEEKKLRRLEAAGRLARNRLARAARRGSPCRPSGPAGASKGTRGAGRAAEVTARLYPHNSPLHSYLKRKLPPEAARPSPHFMTLPRKARSEEFLPRAVSPIRGPKGRPDSRVAKSWSGGQEHSLKDRGEREAEAPADGVPKSPCEALGRAPLVPTVNPKMRPMKGSMKPSEQRAVQPLRAGGLGKAPEPSKDDLAEQKPQGKKKGDSRKLLPGERRGGDGKASAGPSLHRKPPSGRSGRPVGVSPARPPRPFSQSVDRLWDGGCRGESRGPAARADALVKLRSTGNLAEPIASSPRRGVKVAGSRVMAAAVSLTELRDPARSERLMEPARALTGTARLCALKAAISLVELSSLRDAHVSQEDLRPVEDLAPRPRRWQSADPLESDVRSSVLLEDEEAPDDGTDDDNDDDDECDFSDDSLNSVDSLSSAYLRVLEERLHEEESALCAAERHSWSCDRGSDSEGPLSPDSLRHSSRAVLPPQMREGPRVRTSSLPDCFTELVDFEVPHSPYAPLTGDGADGQHGDVPTEFYWTPKPTEGQTPPSSLLGDREHNAEVADRAAPSPSLPALAAQQHLHGHADAGVKEREDGSSRAKYEIVRQLPADAAESEIIEPSPSMLYGQTDGSSREGVVAVGSEASLSEPVSAEDISVAVDAIDDADVDADRPRVMVEVHDHQRPIAESSETISLDLLETSIPQSDPPKGSDACRSARAGSGALLGGGTGSCESSKDSLQGEIPLGFEESNAGARRATSSPGRAEQGVIENDKSAECVASGGGDAATGGVNVTVQEADVHEPGPRLGDQRLNADSREAAVPPANQPSVLADEGASNNPPPSDETAQGGDDSAVAVRGEVRPGQKEVDSTAQPSADLDVPHHNISPNESSETDSSPATSQQTIDLGSAEVACFVLSETIAEADSPRPESAVVAEVIEKSTAMAKGEEGEEGTVNYQHLVSEVSLPQQCKSDGGENAGLAVKETDTAVTHSVAEVEIAQQEEAGEKAHGDLKCSPELSNLTDSGDVGPDHPSESRTCVPSPGSKSVFCVDPEQNVTPRGDVTDVQVADSDLGGVSPTYSIRSVDNPSQAESNLNSQELSESRAPLSTEIESELIKLSEEDGGFISSSNVTVDQELSLSGKECVTNSYQGVDEDVAMQETVRDNLNVLPNSPVGISEGQCGMQRDEMSNTHYDAERSMHVEIANPEVEKAVLDNKSIAVGSEFKEVTALRSLPELHDETSNVSSDKADTTESSISDTRAAGSFDLPALEAEDVQNNRRFALDSGVPQFQSRSPEIVSARINTTRTIDSDVSEIGHNVPLERAMGGLEDPAAAVPSEEISVGGTITTEPSCDITHEKTAEDLHGVLPSGLDLSSQEHHESSDAAVQTSRTAAPQANESDPGECSHAILSELNANDYKDTDTFQSRKSLVETTAVVVEGPKVTEEGFDNVLGGVSGMINLVRHAALSEKSMEDGEDSGAVSSAATINSDAISEDELHDTTLHMGINASCQGQKESCIGVHTPNDRDTYTPLSGAILIEAAAVEEAKVAKGEVGDASGGVSGMIRLEDQGTLKDDHGRLASTEDVTDATGAGARDLENKPMSLPQTLYIYTCRERECQLLEHGDSQDSSLKSETRVVHDEAPIDTGATEQETKATAEQVIACVLGIGEESAILRRIEANGGELPASDPAGEVLVLAHMVTEADVSHQKAKGEFNSGQRSGFKLTNASLSTEFVSSCHADNSQIRELVSLSVGRVSPLECATEDGEEINDTVQEEPPTESASVKRAHEPADEEGVCDTGTATVHSEHHAEHRSDKDSGMVLMEDPVVGSNMIAQTDDDAQLETVKQSLDLDTGSPQLQEEPLGIWLTSQSDGSQLLAVATYEEMPSLSLAATAEALKENDTSKEDVMATTVGVAEVSEISDTEVVIADVDVDTVTTRSEHLTADEDEDAGAVPTEDDIAANGAFSESDSIPQHEASEGFHNYQNQDREPISSPAGCVSFVASATEDEEKIEEEPPIDAVSVKHGHKSTDKEKILNTAVETVYSEQHAEHRSDDDSGTVLTEDHVVGSNVITKIDDATQLGTTEDTNFNQSTGLDTDSLQLLEESHGICPTSQSDDSQLLAAATSEETYLLSLAATTEALKENAASKDDVTATTIGVAEASETLKMEVATADIDVDTETMHSEHLTADKDEDTGMVQTEDDIPAHGVLSKSDSIPQHETSEGLDNYQNEDRELIFSPVGHVSYASFVDSAAEDEEIMKEESATDFVSVKHIHESADEEKTYNTAVEAVYSEQHAEHHGDDDSRTVFTEDPVVVGRNVITLTDDATQLGTAEDTDVKKSLGLDTGIPQLQEERLRFFLTSQSDEPQSDEPQLLAVAPYEKAASLLSAMAGIAEASETSDIEVATADVDMDSVTTRSEHLTTDKDKDTGMVQTEDDISVHGTLSELDSIPQREPSEGLHNYQNQHREIISSPTGCVSFVAAVTEDEEIIKEEPPIDAVSVKPAHELADKEKIFNTAVETVYSEQHAEHHSDEDSVTVLMEDHVRSNVITQRDDATQLGTAEDTDFNQRLGLDTGSPQLQIEYFGICPTSQSDESQLLAAATSEETYLLSLASTSEVLKENAALKEDFMATTVGVSEASEISDMEVTTDDVDVDTETTCSENIIADKDEVAGMIVASPTEDEDNIKEEPPVDSISVKETRELADVEKTFNTAEQRSDDDSGMVLTEDPEASEGLQNYQNDGLHFDNPQSQTHPVETCQPHCSESPAPDSHSVERAKAPSSEGAMEDDENAKAIVGISVEVFGDGTTETGDVNNRETACGNRGYGVECGGLPPHTDSLGLSAPRSSAHRMRDGNVARSLTEDAIAENEEAEPLAGGEARVGFTVEENVAADGERGVRLILVYATECENPEVKECEEIVIQHGTATRVMPDLEGVSSLHHAESVIVLLQPESAAGHPPAPSEGKTQSLGLSVALSPECQSEDRGAVHGVSPELTAEGNGEAELLAPGDEKGRVIFTAVAKENAGTDDESHARSALMLAAECENAGVEGRGEIVVQGGTAMRATSDPETAFARQSATRPQPEITDICSPAPPDGKTQSPVEITIHIEPPASSRQETGRPGSSSGLTVNAQLPSPHEDSGVCDEFGVISVGSTEMQSDQSGHVDHRTDVEAKVGKISQSSRKARYHLAIHHKLETTQSRKDSGYTSSETLLESPECGPHRALIGTGEHKHGSKGRGEDEESRHLDQKPSLPAVGPEVLSLDSTKQSECSIYVVAVPPEPRGVYCSRFDDPRKGTSVAPELPHVVARGVLKKAPSMHEPQVASSATAGDGVWERGLQTVPEEFEHTVDGIDGDGGGGYYDDDAASPLFSQCSFDLNDDCVLSLSSASDLRGGRHAFTAGYDLAGEVDHGHGFAAVSGDEEDTPRGSEYSVDSFHTASSTAGGGDGASEREEESEAAGGSDFLDKRLSPAMTAAFKKAFHAMFGMQSISFDDVVEEVDGARVAGDAVLASKLAKGTDSSGDDKRLRPEEEEEEGSFAIVDTEGNAEFLDEGVDTQTIIVGVETQHIYSAESEKRISSEHVDLKRDNSMEVIEYPYDGEDDLDSTPGSEIGFSHGEARHPSEMDLHVEYCTDCSEQIDTEAAQFHDGVSEGHVDKSSFLLDLSLLQPQGNEDENVSDGTEDDVTSTSSVQALNLCGLKDNISHVPKPHEVADGDLDLNQKQNSAGGENVHHADFAGADGQRYVTRESRQQENAAMIGTAEARGAQRLPSPVPVDEQEGVQFSRRVSGSEDPGDKSPDVGGEVTPVDNLPSGENVDALPKSLPLSPEESEDSFIICDDGADGETASCGCEAVAGDLCFPFENAEVHVDEGQRQRTGKLVADSDRPPSSEAQSRPDAVQLAGSTEVVGSLAGAVDDADGSGSRNDTAIPSQGPAGSDGKDGGGLTEGETSALAFSDETQGGRASDGVAVQPDEEFNAASDGGPGSACVFTDGGVKPASPHLSPTAKQEQCRTINISLEESALKRVQEADDQSINTARQEPFSDPEGEANANGERQREMLPIKGTRGVLMESIITSSERADQQCADVKQEPGEILHVHPRDEGTILALSDGSARTLAAEWSSDVATIATQAPSFAITPATAARSRAAEDPAEDAAGEQEHRGSQAEWRLDIMADPRDEDFASSSGELTPAKREQLRHLLEQAIGHHQGRAIDREESPARKEEEDDEGRSSSLPLPRRTGGRLSSSRSVTADSSIDILSDVEMVPALVSAPEDIAVNAGGASPTSAVRATGGGGEDANAGASTVEVGGLCPDGCVAGGDSGSETMRSSAASRSGGLLSTESSENDGGVRGLSVGCHRLPDDDAGGTAWPVKQARRNRASESTSSSEEVRKEPQVHRRRPFSGPHHRPSHAECSLVARPRADAVLTGHAGQAGGNRETAAPIAAARASYDSAMEHPRFGKRHQDESKPPSVLKQRPRSADAKGKGKFHTKSSRPRSAEASRCCILPDGHEERALGIGHPLDYLLSAYPQVSEGSPVGGEWLKRRSYLFSESGDEMIVTPVFEPRLHSVVSSTSEEEDGSTEAFCQHAQPKFGTGPRSCQTDGTADVSLTSESQGENGNQQQQLVEGSATPSQTAGDGHMTHSQATVPVKEQSPAEATGGANGQTVVGGAVSSGGVDDAQRSAGNDLGEECGQQAVTFVPSDVNPFGQRWQEEQRGRRSAGRRRALFGSSSEVTAAGRDLGEGAVQRYRSSSVDNDLNGTGLPFDSHLSSYAVNRGEPSSSSGGSTSSGSGEVSRELLKTFGSGDEGSSDGAASRPWLCSPDELPEDRGRRKHKSRYGFYDLTAPSRHGGSSTDAVTPAADAGTSDFVVTVERCTQTRIAGAGVTDVGLGGCQHTGPSPLPPAELLGRHQWRSLHNLSLHLSQLLINTTHLLGNIGLQSPLLSPSELVVNSADSSSLRRPPRASDAGATTHADVGTQTDKCTSLDSHGDSGRGGSSSSMYVGDRQLILAETSQNQTFSVIIKVTGSDAETEPRDPTTFSVRGRDWVSRPRTPARGVAENVPVPDPRSRMHADAIATKVLVDRSTSPILVVSANQRGCPVSRERQGPGIAGETDGSVAAPAADPRRQQRQSEPDVLLTERVSSGREPRQSSSRGISASPNDETEWDALSHSVDGRPARSAGRCTGHVCQPDAFDLERKESPVMRTEVGVEDGGDGGNGGFEARLEFPAADDGRSSGTAAVDGEPGRTRRHSGAPPLAVPPRPPDEEAERMAESVLSTGSCDTDELLNARPIGASPPQEHEAADAVEGGGASRAESFSPLPSDLPQHDKFHGWSGIQVSLLAGPAQSPVDGDANPMIAEVYRAENVADCSEEEALGKPVPHETSLHLSELSLGTKVTIGSALGANADATIHVDSGEPRWVIWTPVPRHSDGEVKLAHSNFKPEGDSASPVILTCHKQETRSSDSPSPIQRVPLSAGEEPRLVNTELTWSGAGSDKVGSSPGFEISKPPSSKSTDKSVQKLNVPDDNPSSQPTAGKIDAALERDATHQTTSSTDQRNNHQQHHHQDNKSATAERTEGRAKGLATRGADVACGKPAGGDGGDEMAARAMELEELRRERKMVLATLLSAGGVSRRPLSVELAEAKLNYALGETDAMLRALDDGPPSERATRPPTASEELLRRHASVIEGLRWEREERLRRFRRSRSLSPRKPSPPLALPRPVTAETPSGGRGSDGDRAQRWSPPTRMPSPIPWLGGASGGGPGGGGGGDGGDEMVPRLEADAYSSACGVAGGRGWRRSSRGAAEVEQLLRGYQRARDEACAQMERARHRLRERALQERRRLSHHRGSTPSATDHHRAVLAGAADVSASTASLCTSCSRSLASLPTSGYSSRSPPLQRRGLGVASTPSPWRRSYERLALPTSPPPPPPPTDVAEYQAIARGVLSTTRAEVQAASAGDVDCLLEGVASAGWQRASVESGVLVFVKPLASATRWGFLVAAVVARPADAVWDLVRNPGRRSLYDGGVTRVTVCRDLGDGSQLVHIVHDSSACYLKQPRDFCCLAADFKEESGYAKVAQSVYNEAFPLPAREMVRAELLPSACFVQPCRRQGQELTRIITLTQVDLGAPALPAHVISLAAKEQALCITRLARLLGC